MAHPDATPFNPFFPTVDAGSGAVRRYEHDMDVARYILDGLAQRASRSCTAGEAATALNRAYAGGATLLLQVLPLAQASELAVKAVAVARGWTVTDPQVEVVAAMLRGREEHLSIHNLTFYVDELTIDDFDVAATIVADPSAP